MWRTPYGDRVLKGAEARLFAAAARQLAELLDEMREEASPTGIPVFDRLTVGQRLTVLDVVVAALLDATRPAPRHSAITEGAIAAVLHFAHDEALAEIDFDDSTYWRSLAHAAHLELPSRNELGPPPPVSSDDHEQWEYCFDALHDAVLWDEDYLDEADFVDSSPAQAAIQRQLMRVTDDYFTEIAPDPPTAEFRQILERIRRWDAAG